MGYTVLSRSQLQLAVPQLAELAKDGFVAAYEGPGGVYVVSAPRVAAGMSLGSKPVHLMTYISQPTMVIMRGKRWEEGSANACAQALAMQELEARRDGTVLVVTQEDVARVLGGPGASATEEPDPTTLAPPIAKLLGMRALTWGGGAASIELVADDRHANPMGTLHGGVLCDLADLAMGAACKSTLAEGETFTTLELKINFMKPITTGTLRGDAKVKKQGRTIVVVECNVYDQDKSLVAFATSTCMVLRGDVAKGR
jgi:uncharacterized protein (TIGR00369 family)